MYVHDIFHHIAPTYRALEESPVAVTPPPARKPFTPPARKAATPLQVSKDAFAAGIAFFIHFR